MEPIKYQPEEFDAEKPGFKESLVKATAAIIVLTLLAIAPAVVIAVWRALL